VARDSTRIRPSSPGHECKRPITSSVMLAEQWAAPPLISECGGMLDETFSLSCPALYHAHRGNWVCDSPSRSEAAGTPNVKSSVQTTGAAAQIPEPKPGPQIERLRQGREGTWSIDQGKTCPRYSFAERRHGRGEDRVAFEGRLDPPRCLRPACLSICLPRIDRPTEQLTRRNSNRRRDVICHAIYFKV